MTALFLFVIVWIAGSLAQSAFRKVPRPHKRKTAAANKPPAEMMEYKPTATCQEKTPENNAAILAVLIEQRQTIIECIGDIDFQLDAAPPNRNKLIGRRLSLLEKLATVESRLAKLQ